MSPLSPVSVFLPGVLHNLPTLPLTKYLPVFYYMSQRPIFLTDLIELTPAMSSKKSLCRYCARRNIPNMTRMGVRGDTEFPVCKPVDLSEISYHAKRGNYAINRTKPGVGTGRKR